MLLLLATAARIVLALLVLLGLLGLLQLLLPMRIAFRLSWPDRGRYPYRWQLRFFSLFIARQLRGPPVRPRRPPRSWTASVRQRAVRAGERWVHPYLQRVAAQPRLGVQWGRLLLQELAGSIRRLVVKLEASTGDPATTALLYGLSCSILPALWPGGPATAPAKAGGASAQSTPKIRGDPRRDRSRRVQLVARLGDPDPNLRFTCILTIRPGQIILALVRAAWQIRRQVAPPTDVADSSVLQQPSWAAPPRRSV